MPTEDYAATHRCAVEAVLVHRLERARQQALDGHLAEGTAEEVIRNAFAKARQRPAS